MEDPPHAHAHAATRAPSSRQKTIETTAGEQQQKRLRLDRPRIETLVTACQRARSECAAQDAQRQERLLALQQCLRHDFLSADAFYASTCASLISPDQYAREKISFVRTWAQQATGTELDAEQAAAVGCVRGHLHVSARAGSGKTTTIVHRALFLQQHCRVAPNDMLLLAFNRTAADTIAARLRTMCEGSRPHVMTFHQLAYARVRPPERLLDSQDLSRAVQHVIDDHLQMPDCRAQIRDLDARPFSRRLGEIVAGGHVKGNGSFAPVAW